MCSKAVKNYDLLKKIGAGGLCTIWEARHRSSNQIFAFKQLQEKSASGLSAIRNEYKFLAFHRHPGLVNVHDFISMPGNTGFIMDYLFGPTLDSACGKLAEQKLLTVITEILAIANFVNHCGYIYNDFKPQNFMYNAAGNLKLIDFNLISPVGQAEPKTSGTFGYLAPELLTGKPPSLQSDIYSLGVTFYELACGRMPFEAADEGALIKLITETSPASPRTANENINECLIKMLSPDLSERPQSPLAVASLLGIENRLKAIIGEQTSDYLNSGMSPYAGEVTESIISNQKSGHPLAILTDNAFEHVSLQRDIKILLNLHNIGDPTFKTETQNPEPPTPARFIENFPSNDINRIGETYLVDCRDNFSDDIFNISCALANDIPSVNLLLFTTDRTILQKRPGLEIISLIDKPNRTAIFTNHFLKRHDASGEIIAQMQQLTAGDSEIIYHHLDHLIGRGAIHFGEPGWSFGEAIDYSEIASDLAELLTARTAKLTADQRSILKWLAVLDDYCTSECLDTLTGMASGPHLETLAGLGWAVRADQHSRCAAGASARAIYNSIPDNEKIVMHKQAAAHLTEYHSTEIEAIFRHHKLAHNFIAALAYAYQAARKWFEQYDFKKAQSFAGSAEELLERINQSLADANLVLKTLFLSADIAKALADNLKAENNYRQAAALAEKIQSDESLAKAYKDLGDNYRLQQNTNRSIEFSLKALEIYRRLNDEPALAACFNNLGLAYWISGDYPQALANFEKSLQINRELGDLTEQSKIHNNIGIIYDITGRTDEVLGRFEEALRCAATVKNLKLETKYLNNIGYFYLNSGKLPKALDYFMRCYDLAGTTGNAEEQINTIYNIALTYHKMGEFLKSAEANQKSLDLALSLDHNFFAAQSAHLLAQDCLALGNYRLGLTMLEQAADRCAKLSNAELMADILLTRIELEWQLGDTDKASQYFHNLISQPLPTPAQKARASYWQLKLKAVRESGFEEAELDKLIADARQANLNEIAGSALLEKAASAIARGRPENMNALIADYSALEISHILLHFEYSLIMAEYLWGERRYNEALEITSDVRQTAEAKSCLPILYRAVVLEAAILYDCRKHTQAARTIGRAEAIYNILLAAIPEAHDPGKFNNSHHGKIFRRLIKELAGRTEIKS